MDAIQFFKTVGRICKTNNEKCDECPLDKCPCSAYINYMVDTEQDKDIEEMVKIADRWAKEHPDKTRQSEFLKIFPRAKVRDGVISLCPQFYCITILGTDFTGCNPSDCAKCLREYWLAEVTDND
mgnify:CR=1 FL=1|jgi:hypothetical protein